jgi:3-oxoacyl-[acyl-carrier-protein] synthase II
MTRRRVVISGLGVISPLGNNAPSAWEAAKAGRSGVARITRFDPTPFTAQIAAEVKGFNVENFLEPKEIKKHDLFSHYAIAAAQEAWDNAKLGASTVDKTRMGCILGIGIGGIATLEKYH